MKQQKLLNQAIQSARDHGKRTVMDRVYTRPTSAGFQLGSPDYQHHPRVGNCVLHSSHLVRDSPLVIVVFLPCKEHHTYTTIQVFPSKVVHTCCSLTVSVWTTVNYRSLSPPLRSATLPGALCRLCRGGLLQLPWCSGAHPATSLHGLW